jgi:adenylylsulfate kinase-like enzyme
MVIWLTGLSGSGKTSLAAALYALLKPARPQIVRLDGDEIRAVFGGDLGYAERDRYRQIQRIQNLAKMLADQKFDVLVAALYAHPDLLAWNRAHLPGYFEVYLKAGVEFVSGRDPKALYARARRGEIADVVGVDIPWHAPAHADLVVEAATAPAPEAIARRILDALPETRALARQIAHA